MARKKIIKRKPKVLPKLVVKKTVKPKKVTKPGLYKESEAEVSIHKTRIPVTGTTTTSTSTPVPPLPIKYDGAEVVSILAENETAKHCQMSDQTTKWIPKSVFNE